MPKPKILELNFEKGWRGGERQTIYTIKGLVQEGFDVTLLCRKGFDLEQKAKEEGITTVVLKHVGAVLLYLLRNGAKYNILHAQTAQILTYCVLTKNFHRRKIVYSRRVNFMPKGKPTLKKYLETDKLVGISNSVKQNMELFTGRDDILLISDIVHKMPLNKSRIEQLISNIPVQKKTIIGTIAALSEEKGGSLSIEAIQELKKSRNDFVFLHFGAGTLQADMEKKIKDADLEDHYFLMGNIDDVIDVFSVLKIFVFTSLNEGLGSSILDAFIYGVPVVTTNAGGIKDLIDEERAIDCGSNDYKRIAQGILEIMNSPEEFSQMIERAKLYASDVHSQEKISKEYSKLFKLIM